MLKLKCGNALRFAWSIACFTTAVGLPCSPAHADQFQDKVDAALAAADPATVWSRLEQEAYRGNLKAAYRLGLLLREGKWVRRDDAAAYERFAEAATPDLIRARYKLGLPEAQYEAGAMARDGIGVEQDFEQAAEWFEHAAEQGHGPSQLALARLYLQGVGIERNEELAYFWASLAVRADSGLAALAERVRGRAGRRLAPAELRVLNRRIEAWSAEQG